MVGALLCSFTIASNVLRDQPYPKAAIIHRQYINYRKRLTLSIRFEHEDILLHREAFMGPHQL